MEFATAFDNGCNSKLSSCNAGMPAAEETFRDIWDNHHMGRCFDAGWNAVEAEDKFSDIWHSATKLRKITSCYVAQAVRYLLNGHDGYASVEASQARYFEQRIAVYIEKTQPVMKWHQVAELQQTDLHTLVKFLRKRIPCQCLDKKYEEVRSVTKTGLCCNNTTCSLPDRRVAKSEMFCCDSCCAVCYCSSECQKAHWSHHKKLCKELTRETINKNKSIYKYKRDDTLTRIDYR